MKKEYQWAWIIGRCNQCCKCYGQFPVADEIGQDCNLFSDLKRMQESGEKCPCGGKIVYKIGGDYEKAMG